MKCNIISVGHKLSKWESEGINFYTKQLPKNFKINFIDIKGKQHPKMAKDEILKLEEDLILQKLTNKEKIIVCDNSGISFSSFELSNHLKKSFDLNHETTFVIGGSFGLSKRILDKADFIFSASRLTFPHRLFKLILIEQIYRANSIINNQPYHK
jgi:23S rRNA (pseudouridine1915-N3)-methyltransferase